MKKLWYLAASALLALPLHMAHAQDVVVAHVGPMSGPLAGNGIANYEGAKAYFDQVNAQGGINGQKIRLVREDDQYKADETIRLVHEVAKRDRPRPSSTCWVRPTSRRCSRTRPSTRWPRPSSASRPAPRRCATPAAPGCSTCRPVTARSCAAC